MKLDDDLCPHYLNLDFSEDFLSDDTRINIELPYPITKPLKASEIDPIAVYNDELENHNHNLTKLEKEFRLIKNKIMGQSFADTHVTITKGLLDFCNSDLFRVPYICDYSPYYLTGLLEHMTLAGVEFFLRPDCKNNLRVSEVRKPWKSHRLRVESPFCESITGITSFDNFLLLKHKTEANFMNITDVGEVVQVAWNKKFKREILDAKICPNKKLGYVLSDLKLRLYDGQTKQKLDLSAHEIDATTRVDFIDENTVALLGQKKLKIIDLRSTDCRLLQPELIDCNYLCSFKSCDNLIYLGSRHHLIRTDDRFFKNVDFCSHLMKSPPCYMDVKNNVLCLMGQKAREGVIFAGNPVGSLPMAVPTVSDTLSRCKLQKGVLLRKDVDERFLRSIGGIKLITRASSGSENTFLYSVNSVGDIFKQKLITEEDISCKTEPIENLYHWIQSLAWKPKPLHLTDVANLAEARFALNSPIQEAKLRKFTNRSRKTNLFLRQYKRRYHRDNLGELARNFVSIWEDDDEEEEDQDVQVPEVAPIEKVTSWIESSYFFE